MTQAEDTVLVFLFCSCYLPVGSGHHRLSLPFRNGFRPRSPMTPLLAHPRTLLEGEALPRKQRQGSQGPVLRGLASGTDAENCSRLVLSGFLEPVFVVGCSQRAGVMLIQASRGVLPCGLLSGYGVPCAGERVTFTPWNEIVPSFQNNTTHTLVLLPVGQNQNETHKGKLCSHYAKNPEASCTLNRFKAMCLWPCHVLMWSHISA